MNLTLLKKIWLFLDKISPSNRNLIIIILAGFLFYSQITNTTRSFITEKIEQVLYEEKKAEIYSKNAAIEINQLVKSIAEQDEDAFDVLLLSYHNSTLSLLNFKYLYLSCLCESPKDIDTPLLKSQWNSIDYIYYADELARLHELSFVPISNIENMRTTLPKLYHLVKASDALAISFFTIEGADLPIGMIILLYKELKHYTLSYPKIILPSIQKLAILLDYDTHSKVRNVK